MAVVVYVLCALTSLTCAVLLFRGFAQSGTRLLFWSGVCFAGFFLNNVLLMVDTRTTEVDLSLWRTLPSLLGVLALLYGLVMERRA